MDRGRIMQVIADWDAAVVASSDAGDWWEVANVPPSPSVLHDPATPDAIGELERRVGRPLPPSYRAFLQVSDGADASYENVNPPAGYLAAADVGWFVDSVRGRPIFAGEFPEGWRQVDADAPRTELDWLVEAFVEGAVPALPAHLPHCLAASPLLEKSAVLLNPLVRDADGEWQCIDFYTHYAPTAYRSFADYLESRTRILRRWADLVERPDDDDLTTVSDDTIRRWLTTYGVAPPWFTRVVRSEEPPARVVDVLAAMVDGPDRFHALTTVMQMHGPVALTLVRGAWGAARPAGEDRGDGPLTEDEQAIVSWLKHTRDEHLRGWLIDTLVDNAHRPVDARVASLLGALPQELLEELRRRPEAAPMIAAMVEAGHGLGRDDIVARARREAVDLLDPAWREANPNGLYRALNGVISGGEAMLPILRELREVPGIAEYTLAIALFAVGDDADLEYLGQHLPLQAAKGRSPASQELRARHHARRVTWLRARDRLTLAEAMELGEAGFDAEAAQALLARAPQEPPGAAASALEFQRTRAAADALVTLAEDDVHALRSLARLGDRRCVPGALALLAHEEVEARRFGARALRELGEVSSAAALVDRATDDPDDDVAWVAAHAAVVAGLDAARLLDRLAATGEAGARVVAHWRDVPAPGVSRGPTPS